MRVVVRVIEGLVLAGMALVAGLVIVEVVLRYAFGSSLIVTEELSRYTMVWVAFLGSVLVLREDGHIAAGGLGERLGPAGQRVTRFLVQVLSLVFLVVLAVAGLQALPAQADQLTTTLEVTIFWFYLAIPVGAGLMALVVAARMLGLDAPPRAEPEAPEL